MALLKTSERTKLYFPAFDSDIFADFPAFDSDIFADFPAFDSDIFADLKQYLKIQRNR